MVLLLKKTELSVICLTYDPIPIKVTGYYRKLTPRPTFYWHVIFDWVVLIKITLKIAIFPLLRNVTNSCGSIR